MEATERRAPQQLRRLLGTRAGTLGLAAAVAVLAAIVLIAFLAQYRDSVRGGTAPSTALVAGGLIPKGTSGDVVISDGLSKATSMATDELEEGVLADTAAIAGRVAARDIYPGEQITAADFAAKGDPVRGQLTGDQRAMGIPVDTAHGLIGELRSGDRVDVMAGFNASGGRAGAGRPVVRTLLQNVLVLSVPADAADIDQGKLGDVTLRVTDRQAAALAFAADNGKVWFTLRAPAGASHERPVSVDLDSLLSNSPTLRLGAER